MSEQEPPHETPRDPSSPPPPQPPEAEALHAENEPGSPPQPEAGSMAKDKRTHAGALEIAGFGFVGGGVVACLITFGGSLYTDGQQAGFDKALEAANRGTIEQEYGALRDKETDFTSIGWPLTAMLSGIGGVMLAAKKRK